MGTPIGRWLPAVLGALLLALPGGFAQDAHLRDSLLAQARQADHDTARVWALMEAGKLYHTRNPDSALLYLEEALELARSISFGRGVARCLINAGYAHYDKGQYDEALALYREALPICAQLGMKRELVAAYNNIANAYNAQGHRRLAIENFEKSIRAMEGADLPPHFPVAVRSNITSLYNNLNLYDQALENGRQCLDLARKIDDHTTVAISLSDIGNAFLGLDQKDSAMFYFRAAVDSARAQGHRQLLATSLGNVADLLRQDGRMAESEKAYEEALVMSKATDDPQSTMYNLHGLSLLYLDKRDYGRAKGYALEALEKSSQEEGDYAYALYLTLSDIMLAQGDMEGYAGYREKYRQLRNKLANGALVGALQEFETKYETEQKEQRIRQLEQERTIAQLTLRQKNGLLVALGVFSALLVLLGGLGYRNLQIRKRVDGQQLRIQQQQIKELEQERQLQTANAIMRGQEEERSRIARDLHDGLGGMLSGVKQTLFAMKGNQVISESATAALSRVIDGLDRSINELRQIARNMMPEALLRFGLKDALEDYCSNLARPGALDVHFQAYGMAQRLGRDTEIVLFRIVQELVNNAVKHAGPRNIIVQLIRDGQRLHLTVEDDGQGFGPQLLEKAAGMGWMNIRSRAAYLGGQLDIQSAPGKGTSASLEFTLK
ncbi:MAG: tetratricopeptide repeat protein [Phaeodactylibacter sp.]|nr:tetratricopeptide repeat protein [Phaeodactylibacter sp.]MCB9274982.1 tetratricopeptide repeat protein [Lewinellaceae bacterium]